MTQSSSLIWLANMRQKMREFTTQTTTSLEVNKSQKQILVLDGVRAIACLMVLSFHINLILFREGYWQPGNSWTDIGEAIALMGEAGVILFFLLSGFLLFLPFAKSLLFGSSWPGVRRYYLRRIFRIIPGYYFALFAITFFFHPKYLHISQWKELWLFLTFQMNFHQSQVINGPFWTLAIEFQFYLLLPIIAWLIGLLVRRGSTGWRITKLTICLAFLLAWGLFSRYWGSSLINTPALDSVIPHDIQLALKPFLYADNGKFFEVFALGMFLAMLYTYTQNGLRGPQWNSVLRKLSLWFFILGILGLLVLSTLHLLSLDPATWKHLKEYKSLRPLFNANWQQWQALAHGICFALCMGALLYSPRWLKYPFEWPVLRWIGLISFSLYMWHLQILVLFLKLVAPTLKAEHFDYPVIAFAFWLWALIMVIPVSLCLYRWIEKPGIHLGELCIRRLIGPKQQPALAPQSTPTTGQGSPEAAEATPVNSTR